MSVRTAVPVPTEVNEPALLLVGVSVQAVGRVLALSSRRVSRTPNE